MDSIEILTADGVPLPASLFDLASPRAIVVVSPATATPRGFYHAFCEYLAQHGAAAITYDYRGTFEPRAALRRSTARMRDWGERDFAAVVRWAAQRYPGVPIATAGHSVGGHLLLMTPENANVTRAVNVASQSGHWAYFGGVERYKVWLFLHALMPLLTRIFGYFPGKQLGFGTDLAPGVLYEWSRWGRHRAYFGADPTMAPVLRNAATLTAPVTMIGLDDDPWATGEAIDAIEPFFYAAHVERVAIDPAAFGLSGVGHMGFFRRANAALWPLALRALALDAPVPV